MNIICHRHRQKERRGEAINRMNEDSLFMRNKKDLLHLMQEPWALVE